MTAASDGFQYSDDGNYWWDGSAWQQVDAQHPGPGAASAAAPATASADGAPADSASAGKQYSDDGNYWWDGSQWQPVNGSQGDGSQGGADDKQDAVDWSQFPLIEALTKINSAEDWIRHLGLDPDELNVQSQENQ